MKVLMKCLNFMSSSMLCLALVSVNAQSPRNYPHYAEEYIKVLNNGISSQFSENLVTVGNQIFGGYLNNNGEIIAFCLGVNNKYIDNLKLVVDSIPVNSNLSPSLCSMNDGKILLVYTVPRKGIFVTSTVNQGDISSWETPHCVVNEKFNKENGIYPVCVRTSDLLYIFYGDNNGGISYITSSDGVEWNKPEYLIKPEMEGVNPCFKVLADEKDNLHFLVCENLPEYSTHTSIFYFKYNKRGIFNVSNKKVSSLPLDLNKADKIYDSVINYDKSSIWDLSLDEEKRPVIVYSRFSQDFGMHSYWYAYLNENKWNSIKICDAYKNFSRNNKETNKNFISKDIYKSGGVCIDPLNANIVYLSRPTNNVFEIERWHFNKQEKKWNCNFITEESGKDNIHPQSIAIDNSNVSKLFWCYSYYYKRDDNFYNSIRTDKFFDGYDSSFTKDAIMKVAKDVADWQIQSYDENPFSSGVARGWRSGVLYNGFFDWAQLYENVTGDSKYFTFLRKIFSREYWAVGNRVYNADDICVCQAYLDMYSKYKDKDMLLPTLSRTSWVIENEPEPNIDNSKAKSDRWWWCDALYMAPAVYTRLYSITGDERFMKFADKEFRACYNQLYDKDERLFFRDSNYLNSLEKNGNKVFWGRGNGWVLGGLVEMLKTMPKNDKVYRPFYEDLYKEMCERVASLQSSNGFWHASMLDTETYSDPETSSTTLFTYALAYGINEGYLSKDKYLPIVNKAWLAITSSVDTEGKLGWVQPVGQAPKHIEKRSTQLYGVGGLLMTACEIYRMLK